MFQPEVVDTDGQPGTGYTHGPRTTRPLPAGEYRLHYNSNHHEFFPCRFVPLDGYIEVTVTVTAPTGTVHEAFFDPAALGDGVVGRDAAQQGCWRRRPSARPAAPRAPRGAAGVPRPCGG